MRNLSDYVAAGVTNVKSAHLLINCNAYRIIEPCPRAIDEALPTTSCKHGLSA